MSIISLNFGQCGNQVAHSLYQTILEDTNTKTKSEEYRINSLNKWFTQTKTSVKPNAILIDTETKVVNEINVNTKCFKFDSIVAKSYGGSANNWSYGYMRRGPVLIDEIMENLRKNVESIDFLTHFLSCYSTSGGTGAGVSSYVLERLREEYPKKFLVNMIILPYIQGEIATQNYNTLLNISKLYPIADTTITFENERLHYICKFSQNCTTIKYSNINELISQQIASIFQPINHNNDNINILNNLCANASYKFVQVQSEPNFRKDSEKFECVRHWNALIQGVTKQSRYDLGFKNQKIDLTTISNAVILRGSQTQDKYDLKQFKSYKKYVKWIPEDCKLTLYDSNNKFLGFDKHLTTVSNTNNIVNALDLIIHDAWQSFTHSAYLHHYKKYDIDEEYFLNAFQYMENVLNDYKEL